jgi:hypothetical protein
MFFTSLGVDQMEGFIPPFEAIFEERAKHSVLLVGTVEESANVTLPAEIASGKLHGTTLDRHISPHIHSRNAAESTIANPCHIFTAIAVRKSAPRMLKYPWMRRANLSAIARTKRKNVARSRK